MQNSIIHIIKDLEGAGQIDSRLSFDGFIHFLKRRRQDDRSMRVKFLDFVIHYFEERLQGKHILQLEEMSQYGDLLELVYTICFPPVADERDTAWAVGVPVKPIIVYGTDFFYDQLRDPVTHEMRACMVNDQDQVRTKMNVELVYSMVLRQCYDIEMTAGSAMIRSLKKAETGVPGYYRLNVDGRFIEVKPKDKLPPLDPTQLNVKRPLSELVPWLLEHLPLSQFIFEGISALTVTDVTEEYVVESVKNLILNPGICEGSHNHAEVIRFLNVIARTNDVNFGLVPLLQVNGRAVYSDTSCYHSIIGEAAGSDEETEKIYLNLVDKYFRDPKLVLYETLPEPVSGEHFFFGTLRSAGIISYGLVPVYYNNSMAGVLEVSSRKPGILNKEVLARVDILIPLLAQLLQRVIDEFETDLKAIVKENFTSIQPAVEWKFNEAAWHYERMLEMGKEPAAVETIYFKNVYPLYGAVDIRNSTIQRNSALRRDLQTQFRLLSETLSKLQEKVSLQLMDELLHQAQKWEQALNGALTTADELNLNSFLRDKVDFFLTHFLETRPDLIDMIRPYLAGTDEAEGEAFRYRRELESSIQLVNQTVNGLLEETVAELQQSYPFYFEKFRTDGVEYDIYVGQSISPTRPFDLLYLRNLRLWQLKSMALIARQTHNLLPDMADALQTTQLIFVHSTSIDISFRKDERRFDVEGGYNIRYQVVKKRIDKVRVRDTSERLTQPGKIAIIYLNEREGEEYEGFIRYLQEKGVLCPEVEHLDLEELQGVSGLRALRVTVKW